MPRRPRLNFNRGRNWLYHTAYFLLLAITAAVFLSADWHNSRRWLAVVCFIFLIAIRVLDPGPLPRTLRTLVRSRFRLCPHCRYDLSAIDNARSTRSAADTPSPCPDPKPSLRRLGDEGSDPFHSHPAPHDAAANHGAAANHDRASQPITCPECGRAFTLSDIRRHWRTDQGYSRSR